MKRIIAESKHYKFDSFELCGPCHGLNSGLDALLDYSPYPTANTNVNKTVLFEDCERKISNPIIQTSGYLFLWLFRVIVYRV